jgi:fumarylpyruvate hydrolase
MSELLFPAAPIAAVPVRGRADRMPIHRIFCVGRNYEAHAREMGVAVDREAPFYFTKSAVHYVPSGSTVAYPPGTSNYHIHKVVEVVAHLSTFYHLQPGDIIHTGTPEGVGPVQPGDQLAGSIAGVGEITLKIGKPD